VHTIDRLKGFGYRAVELIRSETVSDQEIAKICDAAGVAGLGPRCPLNDTQRAARISKEVVGIHVLATHSLFACDTPHRLLQRVSLAKAISAPLRF
jgi:hypothetical protein